ncbi:MAG: type II toxin-antitoxin system RelE/ParE family toxin [Magnetococcales bacterium]|nr:type II toxin-antitoxin system RelE/ParE family toxin [Magnetococcales bacterium]
MRILQTRVFINVIKRLHANQKDAMDDAVKCISSNPKMGEAKIGDLAGVRVYKFNMVGQMMLLAYEWREHEETIILLSAGSHENFYRDIKRVLN